MCCGPARRLLVWMGNRRERRTDGQVRTSTVGALVTRLLDALAVRDMQLARVREFIAEPPDHQHVADYYRWTGNAQARQELAAVLDVTPPSNCFTPKEHS
jgi:hypothetical protein